MASSDIGNLQTRNGRFIMRAGRKQAGSLIEDSAPGVPSTEIVGASTDVSRQLLESDTGKIVYLDTSVGGPGTGTIGDPYNTWALAEADIDGTTKTVIQIQDSAVIDQELFLAPAQADQGIIAKFKNTTAGAYTTAAGTKTTTTSSFVRSEYIDGQMLACGFDTGANDRLLRSTDTGATFSAVSLTGSNYATTGQINGVAWDGTNYLLYGLDGANGSVSLTASLSSPSYTNNDIDTTTQVREVKYAEGLFVAACVDASDGFIYTSPDGETWTQGEQQSTMDFWSLDYGKGLFVAVGDSNMIMSSPDGITWTTRTSPVSSGTSLRRVSYDNGYFYAAGADGTAVKVIRSANGIDWEDMAPSLPSSSSVSLAAGNGTIILTLLGSDYYKSTDGGSSFSTVAGPFTTNVRIDYNDGLFMIVDSPAALSTFFAYSAFNMTTMGVCGIDFSDQTENTSIYGDVLNCTFDDSATHLYDCVNYKNNLSTDGTVNTGKNTVALTAQYNQPKSMELWAPIVTDSESDHDGATSLGGDTVNPSFSFYRGGSAAGLTITADFVDLHDSVIASDIGATCFSLTGTPATADDIDIWNNTIRGNLSFNISGTGSNARIVDNITEGNISSTGSAIVLSTGNHRGTVSGASLGSVTDSDPLFSDTDQTSATAFQLQYIVNGFAVDSPLINASVFSTTTTSGQARALGPWNFDTSTITTTFSISKTFPLPSTSNKGDAFTAEKISTFANLQTGLDGTPDVFNDPDRRQFKILMNFSTLAKEFINFIELLESTYQDQTVELNLQPETNTTFPVSVTADGAQSAGTPTVAVTTTGTIRAGMTATIDGKNYTVMYPVPLSGVTTSIVLDRVTETDLSAAEAITITDFSWAEYQNVVPQSRKLTRPFENDDTLQNGLRLEFIKKA